MKSNVVIGFIGLFTALYLALKLLGSVAETALKAANDKILPASASYFTSFVFHATPLDWLRILLAVVILSLGITFAILSYRTKWFPDQ